MRRAFSVAIVAILAIQVTEAPAQSPTEPTPWTFHASQPEGSACPGKAEGCAAWLTFRKAHPWPYQTYAMSQREGVAVAIISEPPSGVDRAGLDALVRAVFGERLLSLSRYRWATGIDGWLEDVVVTLKPEGSATAPVLGPALASWQAPADVAERLRFIDLALHGTGDGFWVENIDQPVPSAPIASVAVQPEEVAGWLAGNWRPLDGRADSLAWSAATARPGVYRAGDGALVALVLAKGAAVSGAKRDFRRFAIESDLLTGALRPANGAFVLLGRKRQQPLSDLPPLRFETFEALAARRSDELAQSYERQRVFAGKILTGGFRGWDWAPILLSGQIQDSEFGTLLNQADQVLKSWSQAGQVRYLDFPVALPGRFPFKTQPLSAVAASELSAPSVIFNWNTRGFSALVDHPAGRVLTADRSGVLPVLYLPLGKDGDDLASSSDVAEGWSRTGRRYFEDIGHPLTVRVAQNTLLYQAVNNLLTSPLVPAAAGRSRSEIATSAIQAEARTWLAAVNGGAEAAGAQRTDVQADVRNLFATPGMSLDKAAELLATSQLTASRVTALFEKAGKLADQARELQDEARAKERQYDVAFDKLCAMAVALGGKKTPQGCELLASVKTKPFLALQNDVATLVAERRQATTASNTAVDQANAVYRDYRREARIYERAQELGRKIADSAWLSADLDGIKDRVLAAAARDATIGSIRTPTLVLSQNEVDLWAVGGHNVGGRPVVRRIPARPTVPARPAVQALDIRSDAPRSMLELIRSRPAVADGQVQATRSRLDSCGNCRRVVEQVGTDDFVVATRPPPTDSVAVVRGSSGLIDALGDLRPGEVTQFHNVDGRFARTVTESAMVLRAAKPETTSLFGRVRALFGGGGKKPPEAPHLVADASGPGEPAGRRTVSLFGDNPLRVAAAARARPNWATAKVVADADPKGWIEAHAGVKALRGARETYPVVVVIELPPAGSVDQIAVVAELAQPQATAASAGRLQVIVQDQVKSSSSTVDVANMAARLRERIETELGPDDIGFYVRSNLGDMRIASLRR